jgi:branched-chain amino acid transport system ATP-binding protein
MLAVARAMVARPAVLLLDEPTLGLAPTAVAGLIASLKEIQALGVSIAVAEQSLKLPLELCDRVYVCSGGRFVAQGEPQEVLTDAVLRHAYLGV